MLISTLLIKTALLLLFCYTIIDVVHFLALITRTPAFRKKLRTYYHQLMRLYRKKDENEEELGCWQDPPEDVKEIIVKHMSFSGRVRLSSLCKSWRIASMRREIPTCPQLPWLVHPQPKTGDTLSFSSLSEGKVFKSRLPFPDTKSSRKTLSGRTNQTSYLLGSSKGWLVMVERELHNSIMMKRVEVIIYLISPISGAQHSLPPLQTIPGHTVHSLPGQVILSSPDISTCIVAATLGERKLIFCRPRDKSWSVFQVLDESDTEGHIAYILFSSTGVLYVLVKGSDNCGGQAAWIEDRKFKFEGDEELELKVIYDKLDTEWLIDEGFSEHEFEGLRHRSYLAESTNNELLLIYQFVGTDLGEEVMEGNVVAEEGNNNNNNNNNNNGEEDEINNMEGDVQNESVLVGWIGRILSRAMHLKSFLNTNKPADIPDLKTRCFRVYKIDPDNSNFRRVKDLGDQILFLGEDYSSLSLLASDFKELLGNCIYFATRGMLPGNVHTSREIGIFYLDSGRIERSFPSFEMTEISRLSWLMPNIW